MIGTTPPQLVTLSGVGIDRVTKLLQNTLSLADGIGFSFGRVEPRKTTDGKLQPWVRRSELGKEYYLAYPNDMLSPMSFSCIYYRDDERFINHYWCTRTVNVIVWANLDSIGLELEQLKRNVRARLYKLKCIESDSIYIKDQTLSGADGVYPGFDMTGFEEQYLTAPFGGFRMQCTVHYLDACKAQ